ncbi:MAG: hypothetical protein ILO53_07435 [Clostridia bacterium]|nr:hypothetical protein [Clostridia bacterium]
MAVVCGVRLTPNGKIYSYMPGKLKLDKGDFVVVETSHGLSVGEVVYKAREMDRNPSGGDFKYVTRIATSRDLADAAENEELAKRAFKICKEKIEQEKLDMKLFKVEYTLDRAKVIFTYMSEQRVDFRNLVKDMAPIIRTRIEMVQVGPREHAKVCGGIGICGRQFCCQGFMTTFDPVTIKMAKDQGLTSNPTKYSGNCGKLLCCIRHEEAAYEYAHGIMPKSGSLIMTTDGPGKIIVVNMLKETCTVKVGSEQNFEIKSYGVDEIRQLTDSERNEYLALRKREKEEMEEELNARRIAVAELRDGASGEGRGGRSSDERSRNRDRFAAKKKVEIAASGSDIAANESGDHDERGVRGERGERGDRFTNPGKERGSIPRYRKGRNRKQGAVKGEDRGRGRQPQEAGAEDSRVRNAAGATPKRNNQKKARFNKKKGGPKGGSKGGSEGRASRRNDEG